MNDRVVHKVPTPSPTNKYFRGINKDGGLGKEGAQLTGAQSFQSRTAAKLKGLKDESFQSHMTAQLRKIDNNKKGNRTTGLPDQLQSGIEQLSGVPMGDVQVHYDSDQPAQLNAHAFAQGNQIHLASGQEKHLPHEAWHVVQQKQGRVQPTFQMKGGVAANHSLDLEAEANSMGAKATQLKCENGECGECENCQTKKRKQQGIVGTDIVQRQVMCHGTNRIGNLNYPGVVEHILIQQHYIMNVNPMAELEYFIPNSGPNGGPGYADIVDPIFGGIYEVKFFPFVASAIPEVARYVTMANLHCGAGIPWHSGVVYPPAVLPYMGDQELVTFLHAPGVIGYYLRRKQREPEPITEPVPVTEQIKRFVHQVVEEGVDAEQAAEEWLRNNPEVAWAIIGLGIAGIIALLADDLSGVGIADDVAIPPIAILIRVAWRFAI